MEQGESLLNTVLLAMFNTLIHMSRSNFESQKIEMERLPI